ncbi:amino acid adenylation domain-containing protein [Candidatus Parabeggiatoa sp. HSG14]|uniref:amino acid adenylation domain-containing protein n=1 Tax=Candidatus Parabeggiatoa sp. HSG14 TaxID=3055593 RepID=UPI0025A84476|nr:amino acid adenylation domain-containing protein [Thiotrichales bacterium HSG14]
MTTLEELKRRAKAGDMEALQTLRESGFFKKKKVAKEGYAVSHAQKRLWILDQMEENSVAYNIPGAIRLEGILDTKAFKRALESVVARHESLRTTFSNVGGEPRQMIHDESNFLLEEIELSLESDAEKIAREYALQEATAPFNLSKGPLLRAKLLKLAENKYVFLFNIHHIVCDEWSIGVLVQELMALYANNPLPQLPIQYKDYAAWQNAQLAESQSEPHREYWHQKLSGDLPALNLPIDYPRPAVLTFAGETLSITLENTPVNALKKISLKYGASLFMSLVAVLKILLYRYTGQEDIIIGTPIAGREHPDLENQIGFYVNMLALRDTINGSDCFTDILKKSKQSAEESYEHQIYPFDRLVNELDLAHDMSRSPLFDVVVTLQNDEPLAFRLGDVKVSDFDTPFNVAKFDLSFLFVETNNTLQLGINYNTDIFHFETINRMAEHIEQLMLSIVDHVDTPISTLNILSKTEKQRLLVEFNNTTTDYPFDKTVVALFEENVEKNPDAIAIVFEKQHLTYTALNQQANQLAHYLQTLGVKPEVLIGLCIERSCEMVIGLLGILKAGGAYLPLDPAYPVARLMFMLEDADVPVLLTQSSLVEKLPSHQAQMLCLDTEGDRFSQLSLDNPVSGVGPENLAYVIYTSGSTGKPKGVAVSHQAINRLVLNTNYIQLEQSDKIAQVSNISFDAATFEIWGALLHGARSVVINKDILLSPHEFSLHLREQEINVLFLTTALFNQLAREVPNAFNSVRDLLFGGEAVEPRWVAKILENSPPKRLLHVYGPTENTTFTTWYFVEEVPKGATNIPIGIPIANTQVYILDNDLQPVPIGISGELHIGGVGLALGYLKRSKLTAEKFIHNPFAENSDAHLYKTGDLTRYRPDGNVEYLGRIDNQVKIRGFRIELGEIEAVLAQYSIVQENAVMLHYDTSHDKQLVAYIVTKSEEPFNDRELRAFLKERLPDYMIPLALIPLEAMPLTPNGKIDRHKLSQLGVNYYPLSEETFIAPRTPEEEQLAEIWADVLGIEKIGIHDNFFERGGHSLKATQMMSKVYSDMEVKIGLREVFSTPTLAELAELIDSKKPTVFVPIAPLPKTKHYAASNAQRRLWVLERMGTDIAAYNITCVNLLAGQLNIDAFEKSLQTLVARHESLRTTFIELNEEPQQKIHQTVEFKIKLVDLTTEENPEKSAQLRVNKEAAKPYNLEKGPLFKVKLYRLDDERHVFLFGMHHIISDGWSLEVFIKELLALYNAFVDNKENPLPPLRIQYKDYAQWQNNLLTDTKANSHHAYWLEQFSGEIPVLDLPADSPRPLVQTFQGGVQTFSLSPQTTDNLRKLSHEQGASFFMTLLSFVKLLMYRYTGQEDIIIGSPVAGREHPDLANQIGFYVNMLALRDTLQAQDNFVCVLEKIKNTVTNAFEHQIYPFDRLVEELEIKRDMGRNPLFDVAVSLMQSINSTDSDFSAIKVSPFEIETPVSKFDLTFYFSEMADNSCGVGIEYSTDLFSPERIERMAAHFSELVNSVLDAPNQPIGHLNILPQWERQKVLVEFNETYSDYPRDKTIAEVFETQVEKTPDNPAVICGKTVLTYQALNQKANCVALLLREKYQIESEECIAVLLDRSEWTAVALVSILKAGGAYVPIDPAYPHNRITYILKDTDCRIVLSEEKHITGVLADIPDIQAIALKTFDEVVCSNLKSVGNALNLKSVGNASNLAYVIYTSGSTGLPKGSLIEQKSVLRLVLNTNYIDINEDDRILQTGSLAFDASTFEIWGSLLNGACLCLPSDDVLLEAEELKHLMTHHGITTMFLTTGLFNQFVEADMSLFKDLKTLLMGGEKVSVRHVNLLRETYPTVGLKHVYGPTENTTFTTYYPVKEHCDNDAPIGAPIANSTTYIIGTHNQPMPIGVPGEICTGGDGLARGYLNQPELTVEKFVSNPFKANEQLYRTGDLGYWLPEGNIAFIGRIDNQVKVRGFRIEPGEIEDRLLRHINVKEAVVITRETTVGTKELIAYVSSDELLTATELRSHLAETLPNYMIPAHIVRLDKLPLTVNGKVDKRALPTPETTESELSTTYIAPRNDEEKILANIWESVLGQKPIGLHDNYFELGGDSIKAIQVSSRLMRDGWKMEVRDLFHNPTIAELAPQLRQTKTQQEKQEVVVGQVPLTAIQQWFFANHSGDLHHFNQALFLRSQEQLDENKIRNVLQKLQEHHDALRITYQKTSEVSETAILQNNAGLDYPLSFEVVDLAEKENEITALESHANSVQASLVLEKGPLMKAVLYQLTAGDRLLLVIHHLIVDGVSWRIIIEDIEQGYRQAIDGDEIRFDAKTVSFKHWAEEVQRYATCKALLQESTYWSSVLEETIVTPLPRDFESEENIYGDCQSTSISFSESETHSLLTGTHHAYHTEINDILLTALGRALKRWHDGDAIWITMEGHGRETLEKTLDVSRTVGWFTSMYPFLLKALGDDIGYQIKSVKEALRQIPSKGIGFGILSYITPASILKETQSTILSNGIKENSQLSFNYLGQFDESGDSGFFGFANESSGQVISPRLQRHHDLDVGGMIADGQLNLSILFNPKRHLSETVEKLLTDFKEELLAVVEHCQNQSVGEKTPGDFTIPTLFSLDEYDTFLKTNAWKASQIDDIYPLSPMQEGLLFESLYNTDSTAYFIQTSYRLNSTLQLEQFKQSWYELSRRHAVLRTAFIHENVSRPLQVVFKDRVPEIVVIDWRDVTEVEQNARLETYIEQDIKRGFDFQDDALMRIAILKLGNTMYQVVWSHHHILFDGWCLGTLYKEFNAIYSALLQNDKPQLPALPPYSDYIGWLEKQNLESAKDFWSHYLSGYEQLATLPKWHASSKEYLPKEITFEIEKTVQLKQLAAQQSVTLNTVIQTLWGLLLSRYNNVEDVVFGAIVSGRPSALKGVEEMVGLFINAIPVRMKCQAEHSFLEVLQAMQKASLESEFYHYCPLAEVQAQSTIGRNLFDHVLVFENYPIDDALTQESESSTENTTEVAVHDRTHYDFDVTIIPGNLLEIKFSFNGNVYPEEQIARTATHFQTALSHVLESPKQPIGNVQILPQLEQQQLVDTFNNTTMDYPRNKTIVDIFEEQVKKHPSRVAVIFENTQLTYQMLNVQANQLANYLRTLGIIPEKRVGICLERSQEMIIGVLGILKAGGAYVPLDPLYPKERLVFMLEDSQVSVLLTQQRLELGIGDWSLAIEKKIQVVYLDTDWAKININEQSAVANDLVLAAQPKNLAYVIYTSGSTGQPKGVMVEHANLVNAAYAWQQAYRLNEFEVRLLQMASLSFDVFAGDLIRALTNGGQLIVCPFEILLEPDLFYKLLTKHHINILESTPGLIIPLMDYIQENSLNIDFLNLLIIGSDSLPFKQYKTLQDRFGAHTRVINSYGLTEATIDSGYFEGKPSNLTRGINTPIGKPLANIQYSVLDSKQRLLPIGLFGELYIGGEGIARGYLNRPALTDERFISHPQGKRLYRTGDMVRWLPDGNLEFQERVDNQVKIRGYRIELGEIENQLILHPSVNKAVVVSWLENSNAPTLVAYVVVSNKWDTANTREYLQATLPDYMIPSFFIKLDELPLTPNGKVDKNALPAPTETDIDRTTKYTAPRDDLETQLVHVWQEVLQIETISIFDNFFELGGHSLKAMQMVSKIHQTLGVKIALRDLFGLPTIAELAVQIKTAESSVFSGIEPAPTQADYDLSYAQQRLWLLHKMGGVANVAYNMPSAFIFEEKMDIVALKKAFVTLLERHEALRTAFIEIEGEPKQKIYPHVDFAVNEIDISHEANVDEKAQQLVDKDANIAFDLSKPPLFRATLVTLGKTRYVFILTIHHIIGDGWSENILYREVTTLYNAYHQGMPNPLKPMRIQYKDFAVWQNAKGFEQEEKYWLTQLSAVPPLLRLPYDFSEIEEERDFRGDIQSLTLDVDMTQGLRKLAVQKQTTVSNVVLALFKLLLFQFTKQEDFCVGVSIANRNHPDIENLIGFFVNILPIRTQFSENMEFDELLQLVIQNTQEAFEHQDYPFDLMIQKLNPTRINNRQPLLNVIYAFQNFLDVHIDIGADKSVLEKVGDLNNPKGLDVSFKTSKFDLTLFVSDYGDTLHFDMEYDTGLFLPATIQHYLAILQRFAGMVVG